MCYMYHIFKREENARHERTNCLYFDVDQKNVVLNNHYYTVHVCLTALWGPGLCVA